MRIILLSGGSGKRLWPLSNDVRSKQFLRLLPAADGGVESMIQRVVRQISADGSADSITIATGESQIDSILSQVGCDVDIVAEPARRDTFPAIALASAYLYSKGVSLDEPVVVMPCDVFTDSGYFRTLSKMAGMVDNDVAELVLMGIRPTASSTKFGYVVPKEKISDDCYTVKEFTEKPDYERAKELIGQNAFWNGGVFAFRLGYLIDIVRKYSENIRFDYLRGHFDVLPKISFDYEVAEKAKSVAIVPFGGEWKDLGTWDALSGQLSDECIGNVKIEGSDGIKVVNELGLPIVCSGVNNLIVAASADGILIADKSSCESIKQIVSDVNQRPMYEERRWGWYKVIGQAESPDGVCSLTKQIHMNPDASLSYHMHSHREEICTVIEGEGLIVIDGDVRRLVRGDVVRVECGCRHAIKALTPLEFIEVELGSVLTEQDICREEWNW